MIKDVFKSITRGFGYSLGKLLFFVLLGLIAFIIGSKAYALEIITTLTPTDYVFSNNLNYDYTNYSSNQVLNYIKENYVSDRPFNYIVREVSQNVVTIYIQDRLYFCEYFYNNSCDTDSITKFALFNYYSENNGFDRNYNFLSYGFEYNMSINYNYDLNLGEVIQPLNLTEVPYYEKQANRFYGSGNLESNMLNKDFHFIDSNSSTTYWIPTFINYDLLGNQGMLLWRYGPNSLLLAPVIQTQFYADTESEDNPPSEETGKDYTNILEEISSKVGTGFQNVIETIQNAFSDLKDFLLDVSGLNDLVNTFNTLKNGITNLYSTLNSYFDSILGFINNLISSIREDTCIPLIIDIESFGINKTLVIPCIGTKIRSLSYIATSVFDAFCYISLGLNVILYSYNLFTRFSISRLDSINVEAGL